MSPTGRIAQIAGQLVGSNSSQSSTVGVKSPDDIVIVSALRTPVTKGLKGGLSQTPVEELLYHVLKATLDRTRIDPALVDDIQVGTVLTPGGGATLSRMAMLAAGFPETTSISTTHRQCSSGLQAVHYIANAIRAGEIDIGIGAGMESMSLNHAQGRKMAENVSEKILANQAASECLLPMGITSENVAEQFGISREKQDAFAARSHALAAKAQQESLYNDEMVPVPTTLNGQPVTIIRDDGVRPTTTVEGLAKLKPVFKQGGSTTAGNASQVSDGAAAVLLMKRSKAQELGLPILGKFITFASAGVPPKVMGIGPAYAIPKVLSRLNLQPNDIDIYEINEAFASQAVYSVEKLGIDMKKVNPKGGAIAIGHPLGCTGARQIAALLPELKRTGGKLGVVSMCIGTGMGAAAVIEAEY
ncbi:3-ketoacyl-CoA thiolase, peroxisomal [Gaertneriomyces sp. JEL0708]|nr:3-ketoacyl-CoA thiolase, peroxisomal [Gaertneriomyces sp. JEL0708]